MNRLTNKFALLPISNLLTAAKSFHQVIRKRTKHKASTASHPGHNGGCFETSVEFNFI